MDRREMALSFVDLDGRGLEIGPSYSPLVTKASGARIETVDHADRDTLAAKYAAWGVPAEKIAAIEAVDHIWAGGSLLDVIAERGCYAYIVASHFLEHTVDMVAFLNDCEALLADDGRLALVLPDKRYCFDRFQPLSTVGQVVDAFHAPNMFHTAGTLLDHQAYGCKLGAEIAWSPASTGALHTQFENLAGSAEAIAQGLAQDQYHDIHHWKFTPASFELLMRDLATLGFHDFGPLGSFPTHGFEFFITLGKHARWPAIDRTQRLLRIEAELAEVTRARPVPIRTRFAAIRAAVPRPIRAPIGRAVRSLRHAGD